MKTFGFGYSLTHSSSALVSESGEPHSILIMGSDNGLGEGTVRVSGQDLVEFLRFIRQVNPELWEEACR